MENKRFGLTGFQLKIIAIVTMTIDHIGYVFYRELGNAYAIFRQIGRLAFPIFCFLLVEGFLHTRSRSAYAIRLGAFCLISEPFFDRAFHSVWYFPGKQNVFFTLLIGFCTIWLIDTVRSWEMKNRLFVCVRWVFYVLISAAACLLAYSLHTDYLYIGVLFILGFYIFRNCLPVACLYFFAVNLVTANNRLENAVKYLRIMGSFDGLRNYLAPFMRFAHQDVAVLAFFPIFLYNGEKGRGMKWFFYAFYPAHLLILALIRTAIA